MRFLKIVTGLALMGTVMAVEKISDKIDEIKDDLKENPPETNVQKAEKMQREILRINETKTADFCNERRLEHALCMLKKMPQLDYLRQLKELREARETIDMYYRTVKVPNR